MPKSTHKHFFNMIIIDEVIEPLCLTPEEIVNMKTSMLAKYQSWRDNEFLFMSSTPKNSVIPDSLINNTES